MDILLVSDEVVKRSITPAECVAAVEEGFRLYAAGKVPNVDTRFAHPEAPASISLYGAYVPGWGMGAKVLGAYESNPERGEPYIHGAVIVLDPSTGRLQALLDGRYLTALRTAAAVAVAARHLCRPESRVLGILGSGLQARTHLLCHLVVHPFQRVLIWGRTPERVQEYVEEMKAQVSVPLEVCDSAEAVCAQADVLSCTTRSRAPLFPARAVRPGTHIGLAGPLRSEGTEIPLDILPGSRFFVDSRKKFEHLWQPGTAPRVDGELGPVVTGQTAGRLSAEDITVFKPVGMAFEDVVSARIVLDRVRNDRAGGKIVWYGEK